MSGVVYDVCVVGAGMMGSAAARHLTELCGGTLNILLIGPAEPQNRESTDIFGAWYDEGRITRILDPDPVMCHLAEKSINNYRQLEQQSGVHFYNEAGYVIAGPRGCGYNRETLKTAEKRQRSVDILHDSDLKRQFPYIHLPEGSEGVYTRSESGYISPRRLVQAEQKLARKQGCEMKEDIVSEVKRVGSNMHIITDKGDVYVSKRVLLTPGAFMSSRSLLPRSLQPKVQLTSSTVLLVRLCEKEAEKLRCMPSLFLIKGGNDFEEDPDLFNVYGLPPIRYPNGHCYMKLGHGKSQHMKEFTSKDEITKWFHGKGDRVMVSKLFQVFKEHFPDVRYEAIESDNCVYTITETSRPFIDMLTSHIGVALGGNGNSAKCCDEIGRIAAMMIANGKWSYDELPAEVFRCRYSRSQSKI